MFVAKWWIIVYIYMCWIFIWLHCILIIIYRISNIVITLIPNLTSFRFDGNYELLVAIGNHWVGDILQPCLITTNTIKISNEEVRSCYDWGHVQWIVALSDEENIVGSFDVHEMHAYFKCFTVRSAHQPDLFRVITIVTNNKHRIITFCNLDRGNFLTRGYIWWWNKLKVLACAKLQREMISCTLVYFFCMENHLWKYQPKRTHISWDMNENINIDYFWKLLQYLGFCKAPSDI